MIADPSYVINEDATYLTGNIARVRITKGAAVYRHRAPLSRVDALQDCRNNANAAHTRATRMMISALDRDDNGAVEVWHKLSMRRRQTMRFFNAKYHDALLKARDEEARS